MSPEATAQIITTNLELWLTSNAGITTDGSNNVSSWADQSGNGHYALQSTAGSRPAYVTSGGAATPTGKASVSFDGSNDYLLGSMSTLVGTSTFIVARVNSPSTAANEGILVVNDGVTSDWQTGNSALLWSAGHNAGAPSGADAMWRGVNNVNTVNTNNVTLALNQWYVYEAVVSDVGGGNVTMSLYARGLSDLNFVLLGSSTFAASATNSLTQYALASRLLPGPNDGFYADVDIASVLIYDGTLSSGDQAQVRDTLYTEFIAVPEPSTAFLVGLGLVMVLHSRRIVRRKAC